MCLLDLRFPLPAINHQVDGSAKCHCENKLKFRPQKNSTRTKFNLTQHNRSLPLETRRLPNVHNSDNFLMFRFKLLYTLA